jgi:transcriptional regulator with XRE-family HTH domain
MRVRAERIRLGQILHNCRLARRLSIRQAAKITDTDAAKWSEWEAGESIPSAFEIGRIAAAFQTTVENMIDTARQQKNPAQLPGCKSKTG